MSSRRQGLLRHVEMPDGVLRRDMNLWPPCLGAGVRVTRVADDYREVDVTLFTRRAPVSGDAARRPRAKA